MNGFIHRVPVQAKPTRTETLARLPLFFALDGKRTIVAVGTAVAP
jgi:hypothetical protein